MRRDTPLQLQVSLGWDTLWQVAKRYSSPASTTIILFSIAILTVWATPPSLGILGYILVGAGVVIFFAMVFLLGMLPAIDRYRAEIDADVRTQEHLLLASIAANTQRLLEQEDPDATDADWVDAADARGGSAYHGT